MTTVILLALGDGPCGRLPGRVRRRLSLANLTDRQDESYQSDDGRSQGEDVSPELGEQGFGEHRQSDRWRSTAGPDPARAPVTAMLRPVRQPGDGEGRRGDGHGPGGEPGVAPE